jgi:hypothetical protein
VSNGVEWLLSALAARFWEFSLSMKMAFEAFEVEINTSYNNYEE